MSRFARRRKRNAGARLSLAGVLRVQGQKDDTADKGREEQQTRCPDEGSAENQRKTTQNPRDHRSAEKQCPLAHAASLTKAAGAFTRPPVRYVGIVGDDGRNQECRAQQGHRL